MLHVWRTRASDHITVFAANATIIFNLRFSLKDRTSTKTVNVLTSTISQFWFKA
jgi:hypothetical protein